MSVSERSGHQLLVNSGNSFYKSKKEVRCHLKCWHGNQSYTNCLQLGLQWYYCFPSKNHPKPGRWRIREQIHALWHLKLHMHHSESRLWKNYKGASLVVQWLRLCAPNAGGWVWSLVRELDPTCHNKEFTCLNYRSYILAMKTEDSTCPQAWHSQIINK